MRDIDRRDPQVMAAAQVIAATAPDAILLTGFDWDHDSRALQAFAALLVETGHDMPHHFAARPNSGLQTGLDLDGDGRLGRARDAQGYGSFTGQSGMAILSRLPLGPVTDHTAMLWRDLPGHRMPPTPHADIQRLSSTAHWDVPLLTAAGPLHLLAFAATPPAFEPRNIPRNHDEITFWRHHLPDAPFAVIGNLNLDPADGDGDPTALTALLTVTQDPAPRGAFQPPQTGANAGHRGDPALDTAEYDRLPGNLRLDYILPAQSLTVADAGVIWPSPDDPLAESAALASHRKLVWVDLNLD
ncbi:MAG: endonuclease/exonuclease/phosphatase family protein [Paracoccus sp. (in: a-proteobacteria)]